MWKPCIYCCFLLYCHSIYIPVYFKVQRILWNKIIVLFPNIYIYICMFCRTEQKYPVRFTVCLSVNNLNNPAVSLLIFVWKHVFSQEWMFLCGVVLSLACSCLFALLFISLSSHTENRWHILQPHLFVSFLRFFSPLV